MADEVNAIEVVRARYRPKHIKTLFVGESAPHSGKFFYYGNTALTHYFQEVMGKAGLSGSAFLDYFKTAGWYLDDLVLTPVDHLQRTERKKLCRDAQASLTDRIREYQPGAIVSLLLSIRDIVEVAAVAAGTDAPRFAVPFAGNGHQDRFKSEMRRILPQLPKEPTDR